MRQRNRRNAGSGDKWQRDRYAASRISSPSRLRTQQKKTNKYALKPKSALTFAAIVFALIFFYLASFRIEVISLNYNTDESSSELKNLIDDYLDTHTRSVWLLDVKEMQMEIADEMPVLQEAKITVNRLRRELVIEAANRAPVMVWQTEKIQYQLDAEGVAIRVGSQKGLPVVIDEVDIPIKLGDAVLSAEFTRYTRELDAELRALDIKPKHYLVSSNVRELVVVLNDGVEVRLDSRHEPTEQAVLLKKILTAERAGEYSIRDYIDLRSLEKAYYK